MQDSVADQTEVVLVPQRRAQEHELIPAVADGRVEAARDMRQPFTDLDEYLVTHVMAESVVDALERVDVEEQQPNPTWPALEGEERLSETVDQRHPIRQPGQPSRASARSRHGRSRTCR